MTANRLFSAGVLLFCILMYAATTSFASPSGSSVGGAGPAVFPRAIILVTAILTIANIVSSFISVKEQRIRLTGAITQYRSVLILLVLFLIYAVSLSPLGFIPSTLAFMIVAQLVLTGLKSRKQVFVSLVVAAISTLLVYFVFTNYLNIILP